jgi:N-dimethylarginine dimethylaminohydrolase
LKRQFPKYNIEETILNSDISHIDTSISPISSNTVLINSDRYTQSTIPDTFKDWNQIWIESNDLIEEPIVDGMMSVASKWVGMNTLSLNETTLFVNECQVNLIEKLEQNNFNCIPVPLKHTRELGGGLHCCTLDLVRD